MVNKKYVDALIAGAGGSGGSGSVFTDITDSTFSLSYYSSGALNKKESGLYRNATGSSCHIKIGSPSSSSKYLSIYSPEGGIILWIKELNTAFLYGYRLTSSSAIEKGIIMCTVVGSTVTKEEFANKTYVDNAIASLRTELSGS